MRLQQKNDHGDLQTMGKLMNADAVHFNNDQHTLQKAAQIVASGHKKVQK